MAVHHDSSATQSHLKSLFKPTTDTEDYKH